MQMRFFREVMDMRTALKYNEDYADPNADVWQFLNAGIQCPNLKTRMDRTVIMSIWKPSKKKAYTAKYLVMKL